MWGEKKVSIDCHVAEDLYTLYKENDVSKETRILIEDHLKTCDNCRKLYENEDGLNELFTENIKENPSDKIDKELLHKIRSKKFETAVSSVLILLLAMSSVISFFTNYNNYINGRILIENDVLLAKTKVEDLNLFVNYVKEDKLEKLFQETETNIFRADGSFKDEKELVEAGKRHGSEEFEYRKENPMNINTLDYVINDVNIAGGDFYSHMSRKESIAFSKYTYCNFPIDFDLTLKNMLLDMQRKYKNGKWTDEDEKIFNKLKKYLLDYYALLSNESSKLLNAAYPGNKTNETERLWGAIAKPAYVDVDSICKLNKEMHDFITEYCRTNKLLE